MIRALSVGPDAFPAGALAAGGATSVGIVDPDAGAISARLGLIRPDVLFEPYPVSIEAAHADSIVMGADAIAVVTADAGSARAANDAACAAGIPFAVAVTEAVLAVRPGESGCLRCSGDVPGATGAHAALLSALTAAAALAAVGARLALDPATLAVEPREVAIRPDCPVCAPQLGPCSASAH